MKKGTILRLNILIFYEFNAQLMYLLNLFGSHLKPKQQGQLQDLGCYSLKSHKAGKSCVTWFLHVVFKGWKHSHSSMALNTKSDAI